MCFNNFFSRTRKKRKKNIGETMEITKNNIKPMCGYIKFHPQNNNIYFKGRGKK